MTDYQDLDNDALLAWVKSCLEAACDEGIDEFEYNLAVGECFARGDYSIGDLLFLFRHIERVERKRSCVVLHGVDADNRGIWAAIAPPSDDNRVRVMRAWRE